MIPESLKTIMDITSSYLVGGAVRDILMGKEPHDYDLTTPMLPEAVTYALELKGYKVYPTGFQYGTVMVMVEGIGKVEITTFRSETYSRNSRKPDVVFGDSLLDDLRRRDFCINSIAMASNGQYIDPHNGRYDIINRKLQFVGDTTKRIEEDPLRMIRWCRFTDFIPTEEDCNIIRENSHLIKQVAIERITDELRKVKSMYRFLKRAYNCGIVEYIFGDWTIGMSVKHDHRGSHNGETVLKHTLDGLHLLDDRDASWDTKIAMIYHDSGKPSVMDDTGDKITFYQHEKESVRIVKESLKAMKNVPTRTIKKISWMVENHMRLHDKVISKRRLVHYGVDFADAKVTVEWMDDMKDLLECDTHENHSEIINKLKIIMTTPRPDGREFLKFKAEDRKLLIRQRWIEDARTHLREVIENDTE